MRQKYRIRRGVQVLLTASLTLLTARCPAQYSASGTAAVDSVSKPGIYRIVLPPSFVACCRRDLADIRIIDLNGREAPYVLKTDPDDRLNAGYLPVPDPKILQWDSSDRHSYYTLNYDDHYRIDRLSLVITKPALYKRMAVIMDVPEPGLERSIATISIDPADSVFKLSSIKAGRLMIDVANQDNAPLTIARVATAQSGICLLAYLEPGKSYRLMAGDWRVNAPEYDLHYFTDSAQLAPTTIGLGSVQRGREAAISSPPQKRPGNKTNSTLLWVLVAFIMLLLLYVSVNLARAIDKKEKNDRL